MHPRLPKTQRLAYLEARYRHRNGHSTPGWKGDDELVEVWLSAMHLSEEENLSPWDALLVAVKRRAQRVRMADAVAQEVWDKHRERCASDPEYGESHNPDVPPAECRVWLQESRNEERILTRTAKMAIDAGVAEAMLRRVQHDGQLMIDAMVAGLDSLGLTQDQRLHALHAMHGKLSGSGPAPGIIEGHISDK